MLLAVANGLDFRSDFLSTAANFASGNKPCLTDNPSLLANSLLPPGFLFFLSFYLIKLAVLITVRGEKGKLFCNFWIAGRICANCKCA